jgi:hypothetical protein
MPLKGRLGGVVAGGDEQEEAHHDLVLLELVAVDVGGTPRPVRSSVGAAALGDELAAVTNISGTALRWRLDALGLRSTSPPRAGVHEAGPLLVVPSGMPMKLPITRDGGLGDVVYEVALAPVETAEHPDDALIASSCAAMRLGEAGLKSASGDRVWAGPCR